MAWEMSRRVAAAVAAQCEPGGRVAILMSNSADFIYALLGILRANCVAVPLHAKASGGLLKAMIDNCRPDIVIVAAAAYPPPSWNARPEIPVRKSSWSGCPLTRTLAMLASGAGANGCWTGRRRPRECPPTRPGAPAVHLRDYRDT